MLVQIMQVDTHIDCVSFQKEGLFISLKNVFKRLNLTLLGMFSGSSTPTLVMRIITEKR